MAAFTVALVRTRGALYLVTHAHNCLNTNQKKLHLYLHLDMYTGEGGKKRGTTYILKVSGERIMCTLKTTSPSDARTKGSRIVEEVSLSPRAYKVRHRHAAPILAVKAELAKASLCRSVTRTSKQKLSKYVPPMYATTSKGMKRQLGGAS